jgi:hypothetical protein
MQVVEASKTRSKWVEFHKAVLLRTLRLKCDVAKEREKVYTEVTLQRARLWGKATTGDCHFR